MDSLRSPTFGGFPEQLALVPYNGDQGVQAPDAVGQSIISAGLLRIADHINHPLNQIFVAINFITVCIILGRNIFVSAVVAFLNVAVITAFTAICWTFMAGVVEAAPTPIDLVLEEPNNDAPITETVVKKITLLDEAPSTAVESIFKTPISGIIPIKTTGHVDTETVAEKTRLLIEAPPPSIETTLEAPTTGAGTTKTKAPTTEDATTETEAPTADTKAPVTETKAPATETKAPTSETTAPTTGSSTENVPAKDPSRCLASHLRKKKAVTPATETKAANSIANSSWMEPGGAQPPTSSKPRPWKRPTEHAPRPERPVLSGWTNVLATIRNDDQAVRAANEAKFEAQKHLPLGEWTTEYGPRGSKPA